MRIGIFTDIHANLPALETALLAFQEASCEEIFHVGDLVGIGPYPKECMELVKAQNHFHSIMGNHDYWYAYGLSESTLQWMSPEEVQHQKWTHQQLGKSFQGFVRQWPFELHLEREGLPISFLHYGLTENRDWFKSIVKDPKTKDLDQIFAGIDSPLVFHGHYHKATDFQGRQRYLNPGAAGCHDQAEVRLYILEILNGEYTLYHLAIPYEDEALLIAFEERKVPARDFIRKVFVVRPY